MFLYALKPPKTPTKMKQDFLVLFTCFGSQKVKGFALVFEKDDIIVSAPFLGV